MAYDGARHQVVLFGGKDRDDALLGDTWVWDGSTWNDVTPVTSPAPRYDAAMAYDASRREVVLFGGSGSTPTDFDDTWVWDGSTWTEVSGAAASRPPARYGMGLTSAGASAGLLLFGGVVGHSSHSAETWEWDGSGRT